MTVGSRPGDTNAHARSWAGKDVSFDLHGAKTRVNYDSNNDGKCDLADAKTGDAVIVMAKLPRSNPGNEPLSAKRVTIKTTVPPNP